MRCRLSIHAVILLIRDVSGFVVFPFQCGISVFDKDQFTVQVILNPSGPVFFVEFLPKLVVTGFTGDLFSVFVERPFTDGVSVLVELSFDFAVCIPGCHGFPICIKPGFTCDVLRVQVGAFHPVTLQLCINHRLIVQTVISNPGGISVFADDLAVAVVTVRQQHLLSIRVKITLEDLIARSVVFPTDCAVNISVYGRGLICRVKPCFVGHFSLFIVFPTNGVVSLCVFHRLSVYTEILLIRDVSRLIVFPLY